MAKINFKRQRALLIICSVLGGAFDAIALPDFSQAQSSVAPTVSVTVNSAADGVVQADDELTLREAIEITNGTLLDRKSVV